MNKKILDKSFLVYNSMLICGIAHELDIFQNSILEKNGLTHNQARILIFIILNKDKAINQKTIEKTFSVQASSITSVLNNLERNEFIIRKKSADDARSKLITATEKGLAMKNIILNTYTITEEKLKSIISNNEYESLNIMLEKIIKILRKDENNYNV